MIDLLIHSNKAIIDRTAEFPTGIRDRIEENHYFCFMTMHQSEKGKRSPLSVPDLSESGLLIVLHKRKKSDFRFLHCAAAP